MSVILITGSAGLVGSEAAKFFCEKGFEVWGIDNNFRKSFFGKDGDTTRVRNFLIKNYKNYKHFNVDIRNSSILKKMFLKLKKNLKLIIHCAGQPSHDWSKKNISVDFEINARGTLNLLSLIEKISGKEIKKKYVKQNRTGDHIWYISSMRKFKNHYPNWKQKVNIHNIIEELILQS